MNISAALSAGGGSGACCAHIVALPFKKEKPGPLGESASKKILGGSNITCEEKAEWRVKCLNMLKVPELKN